MNIELYRMEQLDAQMARLAREDRARSRLLCDECGTAFGMIPWDRTAIQIMLDQPDTYQCPPFLYACRGERWIQEIYHHDIYSPCPQCNPEGDIPPDFEELDPIQITAWIQTECQCRDCRRFRKELDVKVMIGGTNDNDQ